MQEAAQSKRPTLLPLICYRDPERAIEWLRKSFGLETHCVAKRVDGGFAYAHLGSGDELIMVSPARDTKSEGLVKLPEDGGKGVTQGCYFVVDDIDAHFKRAKEAGAAIVLEIKAYEHGGRRYSCRDLEGHIWTFGTYNPWKDKVADNKVAGKEPLPKDRAPVAPARPRLSTLQSRLARRSGLVAAGFLMIAALAIPAWRLLSVSHTEGAAGPVEAATQAVVHDANASEYEAARQALAQARDELADERTVRQTAEASQRETEAELAKERTARQEAEHSAEQLKAELADARTARTAAEQIARDLDDHLTHDAQAARAAGETPPPAQVSTEAAQIPASAAAPVTTVSARPPPSAPAAATSVTTASAGPPASAAQAASPQPSPAPPNPVLAEGQAAMAKGDIEAARRLFKRLADQGLPEAALALGSTYDPANIERAGIAGAQADRARAKEWYRRAIELAQAGERRPAK